MGLDLPAASGRTDRWIAAQKAPVAGRPLSRALFRTIRARENGGFQNNRNDCSSEGKTRLADSVSFDASVDVGFVDVRAQLSKS